MKLISGQQYILQSDESRKSLELVPGTHVHVEGLQDKTADGFDLGRHENVQEIDQSSR